MKTMFSVKAITMLAAAVLGPLEQLVLGNQDCARGFGGLGRHVLAPGDQIHSNDLPKIRDRFGQPAVDVVLRIVAETIENGLRPTDFIGRWLNEEFLAILPECSAGDARIVGERLRKMVHQAGITWWGDSLRVTVSVGAAAVLDQDNISGIVGRAEAAMRASAATGGNHITVSSP